MKIKYLRNHKQQPKQATKLSAGFDLIVGMEYNYTLAEGQKLLVPSGIALDFEDDNTVGLIVPRSGLGMKGLVLQNTIGIIDADFHDEIQIPLMNIGMEPIELIQGMRVAQIIFLAYLTPGFTEVSEIQETEHKGYGSTGN